jgi:hypothetical protein
MSLVKFLTGSAADFQGLDVKDQDTLYFVTDERRIYKGDVPFSGGIYQTVKEFPRTGVVNTLYVNTATGQVSYWNGTGYQTVVPATGKTISGAGSHDQLATTKAVVDYVAAQVADLDVAALEGRVGTLEGEMDTVQGQITTINGEGKGSIKKALSDAKAYTDTEVAKKANVQHTHAIADVTGLQTTLNGKADKATTLAGYGITDAYTQTQTDSKIAEAIAAAPHLKREIVEELPKVGSADANTIYMVPADGSISDPGEETSHYNEYMLINGAFELIGTSQVDLSGYATETFVTDAINALDVADAAVTNRYVSRVVQTNGKIAVTRAALPVTSVTEGSAKGTIAVNGADVNVHGLGTAAYTDAANYEAAGAAAAAVAALDVKDAAVDNQYVSAVSQTDGKIVVSRKQLPAKPVIAEGATNGTISVDSVNVAVHGLKSAAYTKASDYATAAQGTKADQVFAALTWGTI